VLSHGTLEHVRGAGTLEQRFVELVGERTVAEGELTWLGR
jgi:ABC-2 type transport system ATP-binding protein